MGENSAIEWTNHTFNPWMGCTKVSDGCKHCYAEAQMDHRWGKVNWGPSGSRIRTSAAYWKMPRRWNRDAEKAGKRARVFCASLADVFEDREALAVWRVALAGLVSATPWLTWMLLTKRPENIMKMWPGLHEQPELWGNVWLGTSVENQEQADKRIPELLKVGAGVRFLSCEPLLGPVDLGHLQSGDPPTEIDCLRGTHGVLRPHGGTCESINWVICGGESGVGARPMHPEWARGLRDQCISAGVPFFFKQWGAWAASEDVFAQGVAPGESRQPWGQCQPRMDRVGKRAAGRLLDGRTWDEMPGL